MSDYTSQPPVNTTTTTVNPTPPVLASTGTDIGAGLLLGGIILLAGVASAWVGHKSNERSTKDVQQNAGS